MSFVVPTRCVLWIEGLGACDVTNLLNEESLIQYLEGLRVSGGGSSHGRSRRRRPSNGSNGLLYPNLLDPCNKRLIADIELMEWKSVRLVKVPPPPQSQSAAEGEGEGGEKDLEEDDKYDDFYEQQQIEMERMQQEHYRQEEEDALISGAAAQLTRAQTAPLHHMRHGGGASSSLSSSPPTQRLSLSAQTSYASLSPPTSTSALAPPTTSWPPRPSLPTPQSAMNRIPPRPNNLMMQQQQRHSTTAVAGDIESSSSGLRPKVNYKSLYSRSRNMSGNNGSNEGGAEALMTNLRRSTSTGGRSSSVGGGLLEDDTTSNTTTNSMSRQGSSVSMMHEGYTSSPYDLAEESPEDDSHLDQEDQFDHPGLPETPDAMEIAPNVKVEVRSKQETYRAVQAGDYTVATCFACSSTIVCVDDAAYVLCPVCQVVSPLGITAGTHEDRASVSPKKDEPYGIGTGFKREWVSEWVP